MNNEIINFKKKAVTAVKVKTGDFDFDYWTNLAKKDPEAFEVARKVEIEKHISGLEDATQERMRRVQWRVEMERLRSSSELDAASRIYDMMWESVGQSVRALDDLAELINPYSKARPQAENKADTVVTFARRETETAIAE